MHSLLINHIKNYVPLTEKDAHFITNYTKPISVKKKEFLLKAGERTNQIYFVRKGLLHLYIVMPDGKEQTIQFALENWWLTDFETFGSSKVSEYYIQALENSEILMLSYTDQEKLLREIPVLERYFRILFQRSYSAALHKIKIIYNYSKKDIFFHFRDNFPEFIQRVPQKILASFLGLTQEYLSEIRKEK